MQKQKNYKNAGTQILIPDNSVEPLNIMSGGNIGLSSSSNLEGCETILEKVVINRVPVQSKSGKPLMPCKPTKARKLLRDGKAIGNWSKELDSVAVPQFFVWKRYQNSRRQLHRFEPNKKGIRTRYGGSNSLAGFKKNDVVIHQGELARIGGYMGNRMSLHEFDLDNKRFMQSGNPLDCIKLFNQKVMFEEIAIRRGTLLPVLKYGVSATPAPHGGIQSQSPHFAAAKVRGMG